MLRLYVVGIFILIVAIIANAIIIKLGIRSWYDLITLLSSNGLSAFKLISWIDYLWLFIGYPLVLGFGYVLGDKCYSLLFN